MALPKYIAAKPEYVPWFKHERAATVYTNDASLSQSAGKLSFEETSAAADRSAVIFIKGALEMRNVNGQLPRVRIVYLRYTDSD